MPLWAKCILNSDWKFIKWINIHLLYTLKENAFEFMIYSLHWLSSTSTLKIAVANSIDFWYYRCRCHVFSLFKGLCFKLDAWFPAWPTKLSHFQTIQFWKHCRSSNTEWSQWGQFHEFPLGDIQIVGHIASPLVTKKLCSIDGVKSSWYYISGPRPLTINAKE